MRAITNFLLAISLSLGLSTLAVGQANPDLSSLMSEAEITAMGLHKLSPEEQQNLVQWILQNKEPALATEQYIDQGTSEVRNTAIATGAATAAPVAAATETAAVATASKAVTEEDVDNFGKPAPQADEMRSRIPGTFTGWTGESQFVLENGQIWQQRYDTRWKTELENPEVVITRHMLGLHRMEVVGTGKTVPVKRIK